MLILYLIKVDELEVRKEYGSEINKIWTKVWSTIEIKQHMNDTVV